MPISEQLIHLLPDAIANQIAAGEVVQRPASVVKELLENSIDAGAKNIQLVIKDAGKSLIQVIDDGTGMSEIDARMCFERHATSKIKTSNDLYSLRTMGFRGEAMASIAAVAQVELKTKREQDELGRLLKIEASQIKTLDRIVAETGSSISVKNLFFNVPARRNFLKSDFVEFRHINDEFVRIALSAPEIGFSLSHNQSEIYQLKPVNLAKRIIQIFGSNYKEQLIVCEEEVPYIRVSGFVGRPDQAKRTRGEQFFFVNNRFIKSGYLNHAVHEAFRGLLEPDTFIFYVLNLEIDPEHIDINVHPTKTEIKFDDERTVFAVLTSSVKKGLSIHNISPTIDFENRDIFDVNKLQDYEFAKQQLFSKALQELPSSKHRNSNWESFYEGLQNTKPSSINSQENIIFKSSSMNREDNVNAEIGTQVSTFESIKVGSVFQHKYAYLICQSTNGILIIDQQAAHERILYDKYSESITLSNHKKSASQQLLFPIKVELSTTNYSVLMEIKDEILNLGFQFQTISPNTIEILGLPLLLQSFESEKVQIEGLIEQFNQNVSQLNLSKNENILRSLAKRYAIKAGTKLEKDEMISICNSLLTSKNPSMSPNGKKCIHLIEDNQIFSWLV